MDDDTPTSEPEPCAEVHEEQGGRVGRIVLTAPPENALDIVLIGSLARAVDAVARWPELRAVVLEGAGLNFSSGHLRAHLRPPFAAALLEQFHEVARTLLALDVLIIAPVRGRCEGAAVGLALIADLVLADTTTRFTLTDADGQVPPLTPILLAERLDRARAAECLLSGRTLTGEEAHALRLASDYAGGWESVGAMTARHLDRLALAPAGESLRETVRALRGGSIARVAELLPELERRCVAHLGQQDEPRPTRPVTRWRPS